MSGSAKVSIDTRFSAEEAQRLRKLAKEEKRSRANLVRYLVGLGLKARAAANSRQARIKKGSR